MFFDSQCSRPAMISATILIGLCGIGWLSIIWSATHMSNPFVQLMMPMNAHWSVTEAAMVFVMWTVMMGAMMVPSALPMIMAHRRLGGLEKRRRHAAFVSAYLVVWAGVSAVAALLQWQLQGWGVLSRMLVVTNADLSGVMLVAIGIFQFTPAKEACLNVCRTPLGFLITEWRDGTRGAFTMGLRHGLYCVGCCWAMMCALFVFGAMDLTVIALISSAVALEKLTPWAVAPSRAIGLLFLALGALRLFG